MTCRIDLIGWSEISVFCPFELKARIWNKLTQNDAFFADEFEKIEVFKKLFKIFQMESPR